MSRYDTELQSAIDKAKWEEGERIKADPGEMFCRDWLQKYGARFRHLYIARLLAECIENNHNYSTDKMKMRESLEEALEILNSGIGDKR